MNVPPEAIEARLGQLRLFIGLDEAIIAGPPAPDGGREIPGDPEAIRAHVRFDDAGNYRPLSGLRNLPAGWFARFGDLETFADAVDAVYPLAQRHAALFADGTLAVTSLDEVFSRQEGRYQVAANLSARGRELARRALCGACVRFPLWAGEGAPDPDADIPCPEPCSVMLALCREAALWEADPPDAREPDFAVPFAAFEQPGNSLREAFLKMMAAVR